MNRRALIIGADQGNSRESVASALRGFLQSARGGSWMSEEIFPLQRRTAAEIRTFVSSAAPVDYTLVFVFGPTQLVKIGRPWLELAVTVAGETITERELNPGAPRCMLIFDDGDMESGDRVAVPSFDAEPSAQSRTLYDKCLADAEAGLVKVFPSRAETGSPFMPSIAKLLITAAEQWAPQGTRALDIDEAVTRAQSLGAPRSSAPLTYRGGRRLRHFPFSVMA